MMISPGEVTAAAAAAIWWARGALASFPPLNECGANLTLTKDQGLRTTTVSRFYDNTVCYRYLSYLFIYFI
jgi:hypothetical protein